MARLKSPGNGGVVRWEHQLMISDSVILPRLPGYDGIAIEAMAISSKFREFSHSSWIFPYVDVY